MCNLNDNERCKAHCVHRDELTRLITRIGHVKIDHFGIAQTVDFSKMMHAIMILMMMMMWNVVDETKIHFIALPVFCLSYTRHYIEYLQTLQTKIKILHLYKKPLIKSITHCRS